MGPMLIDHETPLVEARVVARPNRFLMDVELDGEIQRYHCPTTGRIGNLDLPGMIALVSPSSDVNRRTRGTVQALRVGEEWLGINQAASNRFIDAALMNRRLTEMVNPDLYWPEWSHNGSRLDFMLDSTVLMEVKTPLTFLQIGGETRGPAGKGLAPSSLVRLIKHFDLLAEWAQISGNRSLVVMAFQHDNPGFLVPHSSGPSEVGDHVSAALDVGVEIWQANFGIHPHGVELTRYWDITETFRG